MWFLKRRGIGKNKVKAVTATDADIAWAKQLIHLGFEPMLRRNIETLNKSLEKKGIRAGIEVVWFFDKLEEIKENESV